MSDWYQGRIVSTDRMRRVLGGLQDLSAHLRDITNMLSRAADTVGVAANLVSSFSLASPLVGLLNSLAAKIQSLIEDLRSQGLYLLTHHNLREYLGSFGLANVLEPNTARNLPRVTSPLDITLGELTEDQLLAESESLDLSAAEELLNSYEIRGFVGWLQDMVAAFTDPFDSRRPRLDEDGGIGGFLFLVGAGNLSQATGLVEAIANVFDLADFRELWRALESLEGGGIDLENGARLQDAIVYRTVQESAFGRRGEAPDFMSATLGNIIPGFDSVLIDISALADFLMAADAPIQWVAEFIIAIQHRIKALNRMWAKLGYFIDQLGRFAALPSIHILPLAVEPGGVPNLRRRIWLAGNRPPFGSGSLVVGGGVFVTSPGIWNTLNQLLFPTADPTSPLFNFTATGTYGETDPDNPFYRDFIIPSGDWDAYPGGEVPISRAAAGALNQHTAQAGSSAVVGGSSYASVRGGDEHLQGSSLAGGVEEESRLGARRPGSVLGVNTGPVEGNFSGLSIVRDSWATYAAEVTTTRLGVLQESVSTALTSDGSSYVGHAPPNIARVESVGVHTGTSELLPAGLLLEGQRTNYVVDSDRLGKVNVVGAGNLMVHEFGAPTTDLSRYRFDSGPVVYFDVQQSDLEVVSELLRGTADQAGCYIANVQLDTGLPRAVDPGDVGLYVHGTQYLEIHGRVQRSYFSSEIVGIDVAANAFILDRSVFTPPVAQSAVIRAFFLSTGPFPAYVVTANLPCINSFYTFSVFARGLNSVRADRYISMGFYSDIRAPLYSTQVPLELPVRRTLVGATIEDRTITADPGFPPVRGGELLELVSADPFVASFYAADAIEGANTEIELATAYGDSTEYRPPLFNDIDVMDTAGTYQGFMRVSMEVPEFHEEHTGNIPALADPNDLLTLSHLSISRLTVWLVGLGGSLTLIPMDPALGGISYRIRNGLGVGGRVALQLSPGLKAAHPGRFLRARYAPGIGHGNVVLHPHEIAPVGGRSMGLHFFYEAVLLWRMQWERGGLSSSIPTPQNQLRLRRSDVVSVPGVNFILPRTGPACFSFSYVPTGRSGIIFEGEDHLYFSVSNVLEIFARRTGDVLHFGITVLGTTVVSFSELLWGGGDRVELRVSFTYDEDGVRFRFARSGVVIFDEVCPGVLPAIDGVVAPGDKVYVGSEPDSVRSCWGRVLGFTIEDILP